MGKKDFGFFMGNPNISHEKLVGLALGTGFIERKRMIDPVDFLSAVCLESAIGTASYNDLAAHLAAKNNLSVSRQAIWKKVKTPCGEYFKGILALAITSKTSDDYLVALKGKNIYKRILVGDSTIVRLPIRLFPDFSGVANGQSKVCNARIQCVYDLLSESFVSFTVDPYSKNDLMAAPELVLQEGDLVLRDRGYLILDEVQRYIDNGAHCIYRYKFNMVLLDPQTEKPIGLFPMLKKKHRLDMKIMLNNEARTVVRLLAFPVSKEVADNRRMKAKNENKKIPSEEYMESLSWSIYITTITDESVDYAFIYKTYGLRWRIEIIFKCWKSNMCFDKIHNVSRIQLKVLLLARFIMITCIQFVFSKCRAIIKTDFGTDLSLLKLTKYLVRHPVATVGIVEEINNNKTKNDMRALAKFCTYDKRKRPNHSQKMDTLFC
jgi:Transposase DDE domain